MTRKRVIRISLITVLTPVVLVLLYVGMAYLLSYIPSQGHDFEGEKEYAVYVHTNGVHLDIAMHKSLFDADLVDMLSDADKAQYLSMGWGDKGFYLETPTWADLKASVAIRAMLMQSATAMHVTRYHSVRKDWIAINVGEEQLRILNTYIRNSFTRDENGQIMEIKNSGYYQNDNFYEANRSYHLFRTCNIWVNDALKEIGVKTSMWSPFDFGVMYHLQHP